MNEHNHVQKHKIKIMQCTFSSYNKKLDFSEINVIIIALY